MENIRYRYDSIKLETAIEYFKKGAELDDKSSKAALKKLQS